MKSYRKGQTILELLFAMAYFFILLPVLFGMFYISREGRAQQRQRTRAQPLVLEAQEAVRSIRERGWDQLSAYQNNVNYYPVAGLGAWSLAQGTETVQGFTRTITFQPVYRSAGGTIVSSGGTADSSSRFASIAVSWTTPLPASVTSKMLLTRHDNVIVTDTTESDFLSGTRTHVAVTHTFGGEVVLGSTGGYGDWCNPTMMMTQTDLPKSGVANAISAIQGQIAAGTGDNASGVSYANVLVTDPEFPISPIATIAGTFDGYKTNDIFTEPSYAYLATDNNGKEIAIIDLLNKNIYGKYQEAGYFNAPGNGDGTSVYTKDNVGYMITGSKLYSFNLASKSGSRPIIDSDGVTLPGTGTKIIVVGSRAYVAIGSTSNQLAIVDISNPANLTVRNQISVNGNGATSLFVNATGTRVYLTTHQSSTKPELFIINTQEGSPGFGQTVNTYDTGAMSPTGVGVVSGPRAIVVGNGGEEYQVINITNESTSPLPKCGGLSVDSGVRGIATVLTVNYRAYSYVITGDSSSELKIIEGGPGESGRDYYLSGSFESRIFDAVAIATGSSQVKFNRISASIEQPSSITDLRLQIAAADPVNNSCTNATYAYVGPDGTGSSYYLPLDNATIAGSIPVSDDGSGFENPGRCFRYRALLSTTDPTLTPVLKDVTISFTP